MVRLEVEAVPRYAVPVVVSAVVEAYGKVFAPVAVEVMAPATEAVPRLSEPIVALEAKSADVDAVEAKKYEEVALVIVPYVAAMVVAVALVMFPNTAANLVVVAF